jgi:transposase
MFPMPKAFPEEFRRDVIAVARKGEAPLRQIAKDFGISEGCLYRRIKISDREDGVFRDGRQNPGDESAELRELKKRNCLLEQENDVLLRAAAYPSRDILPK